MNIKVTAFTESKKLYCTYIKLYVKFILEKFMYIPAFPEPSGTLFVGFKSEPVIVWLFVVLYILERKQVNPAFG